MTSTFIQVDPHNIRWFNNQVWKWMPHLKFFDNCLVEHLRKTGAYKHHKSHEEIEVNKALYKKLLLDGKEVHINNCLFKMELQ